MNAQKMQLLVRCIYNYVAINLYEILVETIRENIRVSEGCEEHKKEMNQTSKGIPISVVYTCMLLCTQAKNSGYYINYVVACFVLQKFYNRQSMVLKDEARFRKGSVNLYYSDGM